MDVREKLVELIRCADYHPSCGTVRKIGSMFTTEFIENIASQLIANGVTVQEWIPVTERLPENIANRVLVVCERSNGVFYAHYEKPFWINLETDKPFISTVTHWMPLPEPPKGE